MRKRQKDETTTPTFARTAYSSFCSFPTYILSFLETRLHTKMYTILPLTVTILSEPIQAHHTILWGEREKTTTNH